MFTGIIQAVGTVRTMEPRGDGMRLGIDTGRLELADVGIGDSIAVSGVCLTVVQLDPRGFAADVSHETLRRTAFAAMEEGYRVNLEKALTLATPLGGHLVSGHVDGTGTVLARTLLGNSVRLQIEAPQTLARYIAEKGSICVDGVSLTVNAIDGSRFDLAIIPHTLSHTTLGDFAPGRRINLEVDIIARYLERLLSGAGASEAGAG
jgi:riboflavin synthase